MFGKCTRLGAVGYKLGNASSCTIIAVKQQATIEPDVLYN